MTTVQGGNFAKLKTPHFFSFVIVENRAFQRIKEGPSSKPSSLKLGSCQGQHSLTLAYQPPFLNDCFERAVPLLEKADDVVSILLGSQK